MAISEILATIDQEIAQLQHARALLSGGAAPVAKKKVGRPKKAVAARKKAGATKKASKVASVTVKPAKKKRKLSAEGRKRIADAAKKRWAALKAGAAK
ncbi:MAG: hypothetical protein ABSF70_13150 [Terracidiphilus sp.]|jgi:hypothetical protein